MFALITGAVLMGLSTNITDVMCDRRPPTRPARSTLSDSLLPPARAEWGLRVVMLAHALVPRFIALDCTLYPPNGLRARSQAS